MKISTLKSSVFNLMSRARRAALERLASLTETGTRNFSAEKYPYSEKRRAERAFTLVESMVAISILSLAVTGPLLIAQKGIASAVYARDQITAFYLAQEAVEYVRNVRDSNRGSGAFWLSDLDACKVGDSGGTCRIDGRKLGPTDPGAIASCAADPGGTCKALWKETSSGLYGYEDGPGWRATPFTRAVSIDDRAAPGKEAAITVTVSWSTNLFQPVRSFTVKEYIFNF